MREETKFIIDYLTKGNIHVKYDNGIIYMDSADYPLLFFINNFNNKQFRYFRGERFCGDVDKNDIIVLVYVNLPEEFNHDNFINIVLDR